MYNSQYYTQILFRRWESWKTAADVCQMTACLDHAHALFVAPIAHINRRAFIQHAFTPSNKAQAFKSICVWFGMCLLL